VTTWVDYWAQVEERSQAGDPQEQVPPYLGTTQFWYREIPVVTSGAQTVKHNRVGNSIRTIIYVPRAGNAQSASIPANVRAAGSGSVSVGTPITDPVKLRLDNRYLFSESPSLRRKGIMDRQYLITGADGDPAATRSAATLATTPAPVTRGTGLTRTRRNSYSSKRRSRPGPTASRRWRS
jgi:hypothetical protein